MRIKLIAVGTRMPAWVTQGFEDYQKRMPAEMALDLIEVPQGHRGKNASIEKAMIKEASQIMAALSPGDHVIALDVKGKAWSTEQLAENMAGWRMQGGNVALLVGGPDGLSEDCLARARQRWSLSALTLPHPLVRVVLAEQLYRAWSILTNHPYHRA